MARKDHDYLRSIDALVTSNDDTVSKTKLSSALLDAMPGLHGPVIASALAVTLVSGAPAEVQAQQSNEDGSMATARKAGNKAPYAPRKGRTYERLSKGAGTCITVTDAGDNGPGTLRDAFDQANSNPGPDCIDFDMTVQGSTITLTSGPLLNTDTLYVDGPGADLITIDGNDTARVIQSSTFGGNNRGGAGLTITGVTIQNGRATTGGIPNRGGDYAYAVARGGGIYAYGSLALSDCVISNNIAVADADAFDSNYSNANASARAYAAGGGVFATSYLNVDNCTISDNRAAAYAAAFSYAYYSTFSPRSYAYSTADAIGGGLAVGFNGSLQVSNSTISGNYANAYAYADARAYYYYYYYIAGVDGGDGDGGNRGGDVRSRSRADAAGGGIGMIGTSDSYLSNTTVSGNQANAEAEAIGFTSFSSYSTRAQAVSSGGGLQSGDDSLLEHTTVTGNRAAAYVTTGTGAYEYGLAIGGGVSDYNPSYFGNRDPNNRGFNGVRLRNSIVDGNSVYSGYFQAGYDLYDYSSDSTYSLIGSYFGHDVTGGSNGNIVGTSAQLGPLADNGGDTYTHLPMSGSPVIDAGDSYFSPPPYYDQRGDGFPRVVGGYLDMGAVEYSGVTPNYASLSLTGSPFSENGGSAVITATLSQPASGGVNVLLGLSGTATYGADFTTTAQIYVADGLTTGTTTLYGVDDNIFEYDETITADITSITGNAYEYGVQQVTATITSDDAQPEVNLQFNRGGSIPENGGNTDITATLSNPSVQTVDVTLNFPADQATYGVDFDMASTTISIPPGNTSGSQQLDAIDDAVFEGDETFTVAINGVNNGSIGAGNSVQGVIQDDEGSPPVTLSLAGSPFAEPGGVATVTVTRGGQTTLDCIVDLGFSGVAVNGVDFTPSATQVTIPSAGTMQDVTLTGIDDMLGEGDEDVIVDIVSAMNCTESGTQQVTAIITDDDEFVANVSAAKTVVGMDFMPGDPITYMITLTNAGPGMQQDNPGDEFVDILPPELLLVSATADSGTATANVGTNTVTWNGGIDVGTPVNIMINAQILLGVDGQVFNQGTVNFDSDGDGTNDTSAPTDDPDQPGATDPTPALVLGTPLVIPTMSSWGLTLLGLLLPMTAVIALRRRGFKL